MERKTLKIPQDIEAIIFDMEGVIIDSEKIWQKEDPKFLSQFIPEVAPKFQKKIIGKSTLGIFEMLKKEYSLQIKKNDFLKAYHDFGLKNIFPYSSLSPNFLNLLKKLSKNYKIALASSSPHVWIDFVLAKFDLRGYFPVVVSADDLGGKGKPDPAIYLDAAKKIKTKPENCLVFEDSDNGALSAKTAGMLVYGFRNGYNDAQTLEKADEVFSDFSKIGI